MKKRKTKTGINRTGTNNTGDSFLYQEIAADFAEAIGKGVYAVDERMPSLRRVASHYRVSMATVIQAYAGLEDRGLIEARARSGYYVTSRGLQPLPEPAASRSNTRATNINVGQLALALVSEGKSTRFTRLGAAVPGIDLLPLQNLGRCLAGAGRRHWLHAGAYEQPDGVLELRRQIARLMRQAGCRCTPDDIVITNGCLEALTLSLKGLCKAGDVVAVESPTYFGVLQVMESLGLKALEIATHPILGVDIAALEQALIRGGISVCILMPNQHNPLGARMPDTRKKQVVELLEKHQVPLIEDDVYGALAFETPRPKAAKAYDRTGNVTLCSSFSKTIAPGMRIGWVFTGRHRDKIIYYKFLQNISTATLPQYALAAFLARGGYSRALAAMIRACRVRVEQLRFLINRYFPPGTRCSNPQGGYMVWIEMPPQVDAMDLYNRALQKNITISPGVLFCADGRFYHHIRLSCGVTAGQSLENAVKTIGRMATAMARENN